MPRTPLASTVNAFPRPAPADPQAAAISEAHCGPAGDAPPTIACAGCGDRVYEKHTYELAGQRYCDRCHDAHAQQLADPEPIAEPATSPDLFEPIAEPVVSEDLSGQFAAELAPPEPAPEPVPPEEPAEELTDELADELAHFDGAGVHFVGAIAGPPSPTPLVDPIAQEHAYAHALVTYAAQLADLLGLPNEARPTAPNTAQLTTQAKTAHAQLAHACGLLGPLVRHVDPELSPDAARSFSALAVIGKRMRDRRDREARELAEAQAPEPPFDGAPPHLLRPAPAPIADPPAPIAGDTHSAASSPAPAPAALYPLTEVRTEHDGDARPGADVPKLLACPTAALTFEDTERTKHLFIVGEPLPLPWDVRLRHVGTIDAETEATARTLLSGRWRNDFKRSLTAQVIDFLLADQPRFPTPLTRKQVRAYQRGEARARARAAERMRGAQEAGDGRDYAAG